MCVVLYCCVQYVEVYTEQRAFVDSIKFLFSFEKIPAKSYRLLREAYDGHAQLQDMCERWFWRFKSGDFNTKQERRLGTWKTARKV